MPPTDRWSSVSAWSSPALRPRRFCLDVETDVQVADNILVDTRGRVVEVKVLRGAPLFDDAAIAAVKQWRYQPLLLNGVPTEFILTVTLKFNLARPD